MDKAHGDEPYEEVGDLSEDLLSELHEKEDALDLVRCGRCDSRPSR